MQEEKKTCGKVGKICFEIRDQLRFFPIVQAHVSLAFSSTQTHLQFHKHNHLKRKGKLAFLGLKISGESNFLTKFSSEVFEDFLSSSTIVKR